MEQGKHSTGQEKRQQLSERERYKMEGYIEAGKSAAEIAELLKKSKRTIERERKLGLVEQKRMNPSFKKNEPMYIVEMVYKADAAQRRRKALEEKKIIPAREYRARLVYTCCN